MEDMEAARAGTLVTERERPETPSEKAPSTDGSCSGDSSESQGTDASVNETVVDRNVNVW